MSSAKNIYLDHAATTPLRAEVRAAMEPYLVDNFANASSVYRMAQGARSALDRARDGIARELRVRSSEIIFTSGGTESNNAAIKGVALSRRKTSAHVVTTSIEHHAVLHPVEELSELFDSEVSVVPVNTSGIVSAYDVEQALRPDTALVSVMWANNEIGTIQPIAEIAAMTRRRGIALHVDAVQAAAALDLDLSAVPVDLLSISAHKFYGPKGVGALFVRTGTPWWPLLTGGGQERNRRAGTENVAGIVGMSAAFNLASQERESSVPRLTRMRDWLLNSLCDRIPGVHVNGSLAHRLPNNVNVSLENVHGESLLVGLDLAGIMASSGSACTSGTLEPSHVLQAIGVSRGLATSSLRLTLGHENTAAELEHTIQVLEVLVTRLRKLAPATVE